jgi:anti-sigma B factor antagonist
MTELRVRVEALDGIEVLALEGEADLSTVDEFIQRLLELSERGDARIVLDLTPATFIDSTVVNALLASTARIRRAGGDLVVVCPNAHLRRVFELTGLDAMFGVVDTRDDALAALSG